MLKWMIGEGYGDVRTITRRIKEMQKWLANPELLEADADAEYAETLEIDLNEITEPILCCPNDPDDAKTLSDIISQGEVKIDEVFIGSCMTNIGHFRAASKLFEEMGKPVPTRTWIVPPTKMDEAQLIVEGHYAIFGNSGARTEIPGCSLCMGNQARVAAGSTVVSTSTRNFPNRLGDGANVYLASAELSAVCAVMGRLPSVAEYLDIAKNIDMVSDDIYKYLNFNELPKYQDIADEVVLEA